MVLFIAKTGIGFMHAMRASSPSNRIACYPCPQQVRVSLLLFARVRAHHCRLLEAMAPHLSQRELVDMRRLLSEGKTPIEIWRAHKTSRKADRIKPVGLTAIRKTLKAKTHRFVR